MKRKIFSKLKDYNYILDRMLEKKNFSEDAKNLLLSMIYKIETSYDDYAQIKGIYKTKNEFVDDIVEIVSNNCKYIFLIDPKKDGVKLLKKENVLALTDEKEQRIYSYPTEQAILYGIFDIKPKYFYIPANYYYIKKQFQKILVEGTILNSTEVIRNFNGWSWSFEEDNNINYVANMIYQTIRILVGEEFLQDWENDASGKVDYIYEFRNLILEKYGKEISRSLYFALARLIVFSSKKDFKEKLKTEYVKVVKAYNNMKDKTAYIYKISEEKKKLNDDIEQKDIIMNDKEELHKEFERRNKELPDEKKIFNVSSLIEILQSERDGAVKRIKELNELVKPAKYSKLKNELVEKIKIMSVITEEKNLRELCIEYQKEVLKCLQKNVESLSTKEEILEIIYKMRYYRKIRTTQSEKLEDIPALEKQFENMLKYVVTIACKKRMFNIFCNDVEYNYKIISKALDTTVTNYENVDISIEILADSLEITIYDNEVVDKQERIDLPENKEDLVVKPGRKVPLYVF